MPSAAIGYNHFTSYNRRRILNDSNGAPLIKKIEDQLPLVVTLENKTNDVSPLQQQSDRRCCGEKAIQLAKAESREQKLLEEVERLKTKLKSKSHRHKHKLEEKEKQHQAVVEAKDQEIERLKAELEAAKAANKKQDDKKSSSRTRRKSTSRRSSWSQPRRHSSSSTRNKLLGNNSLRGLRSIPVRQAFSIGGQKPSRDEFQ